MEDVWGWLLEPSWKGAVYVALGYLLYPLVQWLLPMARQRTTDASGRTHRNEDQSRQ